MQYWNCQKICEKTTNIVAPLDFVGSRIGSDFTVHIHVIALRNGFGIDAAAKTQSHFGWIWKRERPSFWKSCCCADQKIGWYRERTVEIITLPSSLFISCLNSSSVTVSREEKNFPLHFCMENVGVTMKDDSCITWSKTTWSLFLCSTKTFLFCETSIGDQQLCNNNNTHTAGS